MARGTITRMVSDRTGRISWRARFSYTGADGRRKHRSRSFTIKKHAEAWMRQRVTEAETGSYADLSAETVADVYRRWIAHVERTRAESTTLHYRSWWTRTIAPVFGTRRITSIRSTDVQAFYDGLDARYAPTTVSVIRVVLNGVFATAVQDGVIATNPTVGRRTVTAPRRRPVVWTPDQARRFLDAATLDNENLWIVMLTTGLRIGEALALHWEDVDIDRRRALVRRTWRMTGAGRVIVEATKTRSSRRTIALPAIAIMALHRQPRRGALVFTAPDGASLTPSMMRPRLDRLCARYGVPRITPHGLRHTAATVLLHQGIHPKIVAEQLGHASVTMTLDLYSHVDATLKERAADAMDVALGTDLPSEKLGT